MLAGLVAGIELDTKWGGFKNLFGGEGGFLVHASGQGTVLLACYGALDTVQLAPGESITIDTGHVVAFNPGIQSQIRKVASGVMATLKSGEGFVFDFAGPGWVMTADPQPERPGGVDQADDAGRDRWRRCVRRSRGHPRSLSRGTPTGRPHRSERAILGR